MIDYIEIFEEERIVWKKVKNVISNQNAEESCIQKATVIMLFIGPYDLVNTCWPNIKHVIESIFTIKQFSWSDDFPTHMNESMKVSYFI